MYRKKGVKREGVKERKTSGLKTFRELARPLTSAYVCLCGHRVRPSTAISNKGYRGGGGVSRVTVCDDLRN